jgi:hypothetical protein
VRIMWDVNFVLFKSKFLHSDNIVYSSNLKLNDPGSSVALRKSRVIL